MHGIFKEAHVFLQTVALCIPLRTEQTLTFGGLNLLAADHQTKR